MYRLIGWCLKTMCVHPAVDEGAQRYLRLANYVQSSSCNWKQSRGGLTTVVGIFQYRNWHLPFMAKEISLVKLWALLVQNGPIRRWTSRYIRTPSFITYKIFMLFIYVMYDQLLPELRLMVICMKFRYDYLPYFYSRVFEYEGSARKIWWQFYGDNGKSDALQIFMSWFFYLTSVCILFFL